ncbi:MAG: 7-carboxy-7-deazaguanine synthase [Syntrophorhabdaceae bacterium]
MAYRIKEIFYSLQGEGINTGRPAVFVRFSGCNLWSGRMEGRANIPCPFCDTDFVGTDGPLGGEYGGAHDIVSAMKSCLPRPAAPDMCRFAVLTGGEPALQADQKLIDHLHGEGWVIAIETNGTCPIPEGLDWVTVSPKGGYGLAITGGDELKLLYPQRNVDPATFESLEFTHFILQPVHDASFPENQRLAVEYCLTHPRWRFGMQLHKILGIR